MVKFIQTLDPEIYKRLKEVGKKRGQSVQELIRAIVGEWLEEKAPA